MRMWRSRKPGFLFWVCMLFLLQAHGQDVSQSDNTGFTYQGRLNEQEQSANGAYDFQFQIFDKAAEGTSLGKVVTLEDVKVTDGYFSVKLDFGSGVFTGDPRFLQIGVRKGNETSDYTVLQPRQEITPAPYALYAQKAPQNYQFNTADGLQVTNTSTSPNGYAIMAESRSVNGVGIVGIIRDPDGSNGTDAKAIIRKILFEIDSPAGIYGILNKIPGSGVIGKVFDMKDIRDRFPLMQLSPINPLEIPSGVRGENINYYGGIGVFGRDISKNIGYGGYFQTSSTSGAGVFGLSHLSIDKISETGIGVWGVANSRNGIGLKGQAYDDSKEAKNYGVYGTGAGGKGIGVYGESPFNGVYGFGFGPNSIGVKGKGTINDELDTRITTGVIGISDSRSGRGVIGLIDLNGDEKIPWIEGEQGFEPDQIGVLGAVDFSKPDEDDLSNGVVGVAGMVTNSIGTGVYGAAGYKGVSDESIGVMGTSYSDKGSGVQGYSKSEKEGYGIKGISDGVNGVGVSGISNENGVGIKAYSASGNPIEAWNASQVVFKVDNSGNAYADGTYQSPAADFAEMLPAAGNLEPGDVLAVGKDGKVVLAGSQNPLSIIGVHSTQPAFLGGHSADNQDTSRVPVAIVGVVPVKVTAENGPILPNDSLTVSPTRAGRAAKAVPLFTLENGQGIYAGGTILGKALTPLSQGEGVVQVLLQLR